jgi:DNA mismatch repair protein MSH5
MYVSVPLRSISKRTYHLPNPYGNSCAALNGISKPIVNRANELASLAVRGEDLIAACVELSEEEMQALREAVRATSFFLC